MKTVLITLGDPSGLGPELVVRLFGRAAPADCRVLLLGPEAAMRESCSCGSVASFWKRLDDPAEAKGQGPGVYLYEPPELAGVRTVPGKPSEAGGLCAGVCLEAAVALLRAGVGHGLCTCPLNKATLQAAGFDFPGHTEFLAERLGVGRDGVCMHLGGTRLRVSLVTTHPPLAEVPRLVTRERILRCLELTAAYLDSIGVAGPIGVCGLNPHAGESGRIGREDLEVVGPAVELARERGIPCAGPIPADTLFHFAARGDYGAVLAMYHDQGLAPLKLLHFSEAVNVTLGLPYPRTSPDHGTGYDIVGTGKADLTSFSNAFALVRRMVGE